VRRGLGFGLLAVALLAAAPAWAGWRDTQWRMTLDQVRALYPDIEADPFFPPGLDVKSPVDYLYHSFQVRLIVYRDALIGVRMELLGERGCGNLLPALTRQYGKPSDIINGRDGDPVIKSWQWYLDDDDIALDLHRSGACSLRYYDARVTEKPSGLPL